MQLMPTGPDPSLQALPRRAIPDYLMFRKHHPLESSVVQDFQLHHKLEVPSSDHQISTCNPPLPLSDVEDVQHSCIQGGQL